ncbi:MAG TPA: T9SS type A sorting domain-containing protein, partial [Bacteroidales bacterium]
MKKLIVLLIVLPVYFLFNQLHSQEFYLDFDYPYGMEHVQIDTSNAGNLWQIGPPQKAGFNTALSQPNVMITDTINPYPADNYSVFTIWDIIDEGYYFGLKTFRGAYKVQSDSLHDFGMMEFSHDMGSSWIDMINDTVFMSTFIWFTPKPVLTGTSGSWEYFELTLADIASAFNLQIGDTVLYRFSFRSDANADTLAGLMYDNFSFGSWVEGISETRFKSIESKIYPNPSNSAFTIAFSNPKSASFQLSVYDINSKLIFSTNNILGNDISFDASEFVPG